MRGSYRALLPGVSVESVGLWLLLSVRPWRVCLGRQVPAVSRSAARKTAKVGELYVGAASPLRPFFCVHLCRGRACAGMN